MTINKYAQGWKELSAHPLPPVDFTRYTLGELLNSKNTTIRRAAISILRTFQKELSN